LSPFNQKESWNFAEKDSSLTRHATRDLSGQSVEIGNFLSDPQKGGPLADKFVIM